MRLPAFSLPLVRQADQAFPSRSRVLWLSTACCRFAARDNDAAASFVVNGIRLGLPDCRGDCTISPFYRSPSQHPLSVYDAFSCAQEVSA